MSDMEWIRTLQREAGFRRCLILYGNVRDLWPTNNGNQDRLAEYITSALGEKFTLQGTWIPSMVYGFQTNSPYNVHRYDGTVCAKSGR